MHTLHTAPIIVPQRTLEALRVHMMDMSFEPLTIKSPPTCACTICTISPSELFSVHNQVLIKFQPGDGYICSRFSLNLDTYKRYFAPY
jgi:hypothetical protein